MATPTTLLDWPLGQGLNEAVDPRLLPMGAAAVLTNLEVDQAGSLVQRRSLVRQTWDQPGPVARLLGRGQELHQIVASGTPSRVRLQAKHAVGDGWTSLDPVAPCSVERRGLLRPAGTTQGGSLAPLARDRQIVTAQVIHGTSYANRFRIVDRASGATVAPDTFLSSGTFTFPPVAAPLLAAGQCWLIYSSGNDLIASRRDDTGTSLQTVVLATTPSGVAAKPGFRFDAVCHERRDEVFVVWSYQPSQDTSVASDRTITLVRLDATGLLATQTIRTGTGNVKCVAVAGGASGAVLVAWTEEQVSAAGPPVVYAPPSHWVAAYAPVGFATLRAPLPVDTSTTGATVPRCAVAEDDQGRIRAAYDQWDATQGPRVQSYACTLAGVVSEQRRATRCRLASHLRQVDTVGVVGALWAPEAAIPAFDDPLGSVSTGPEHLVLVGHDQGTTLLSQPYLLARLATVTGGRQTLAHLYPRASSGEATRLAFVVGALLAKGKNAGDRAEGIDRLDLDLRPQQSALHATAEAAPLWLLSGGLVQAVDGARVVESGFVQAPSILATVSASAGNLTAVPAPGNAYLYRARYEWPDDRGQTHVGPWSLDVTVTLTNATTVTNKAVDLVLGCTSLSRRDLPATGGRVQIAVYRSLANGASQAGEVPLYRLTGPTAQANGVAVYNDPLTGSVPFLDTVSDAGLLARGYGVVLSVGDLLPPVAPPPAAHLCVHRERVWLASSEDGVSLWPSRLLTASEPPCWPQELVVRLSDAPDRITALASLDDKLIVFTSTRIYQVVGDGPADNGVGQGWAIYLVQAQMGCTDARSVVATPEGVYFLGPGGLRLLTRALEVQPAGEAVRATLTAMPTVLDAHHDAVRMRAVWLLTNGGASRWLVRDYLHGVWSTQQTTGLLTYALTPWADRLVALEGTDYLLESDSALGDGAPGAPTVPVAVYETPWIAPGGVGATQRVRQMFVLGQRLNTGLLTVQVYQNFKLSEPQTIVLDLTGAGSLAELPLLRYTLPIETQQCEAIKVRFTSSAPVAPGVPNARPGVRLQRLTFDIGQEPGTPRLPATNRGGA